MPIDINAFRAISVKMDGDSLLYVQGDKLKTTSAREVGSDSSVHRQFKAATQAFLLEMLPLYHGHEKTFDKGTNWHGRTHATRSFVLSIAMANILRERGVALDINSVALVTAGHDTGRMGNGADHTVNMEMLNAATAGEAELKRQGRSNVWLAQQLLCNPRTISKIFQKRYIDTCQLWQISKALDHDFFHLYSDLL